MSTEQLRRNRSEAHPVCVACSPRHPAGLKLDFEYLPDGTVEGRFPCSDEFVGYPGIVHGGIVAMLLDSAMTNCLFAHGYRAYTADLNVRYHAPVAARQEAVVRSSLNRHSKHLFLLTANVSQNGHIRATARAKFIDSVSRLS